MAIQSREFVGIAEGIKSHELSAKGKIENLKGTILKLSEVKSSLNDQISSLEAALAAAYEDTDEDGNPDYSRISAIEARISSAKNQLYAVKKQIDETNNELQKTESELDSVMEEKARTLFEIQERARKTANNITVSGGMYGAYSGVGSALQSTMQTSLAALSQAATILDGSVQNSSSSRGGNSTGGRGVSSSRGMSTNALSAFVAASSEILSGDVSPTTSTPSTFATSHLEDMSPATVATFKSGQNTINPQKTLNFKTDQVGNSYAVSSFSETDTEGVAYESNSLASNYRSSQKSPNMETRIVQKESAVEGSGATVRGDLAQRRAWAQQYEVGFTPVPSSLSSNKRKVSTSAPKKDARELADELDYELSIGSLLSKFSKGKKTTISTPSTTPIKTTAEKRKEFLQRLHYDAKIVANVPYTTINSSNNDDDDAPNIGAKIKQHNNYDDSRERELSTKFGLSRIIQGTQQTTFDVQDDINNIRAKLDSFIKNNRPLKKINNSIDKAQKIIDNYCNKTLINVLSKEKRNIRLNDTVVFQNDEEFANGLKSHNGTGINGYNNGKKSYVKKSGPHPIKTAIHEHNHQLSCNDVKDNLGYTTKYIRGVIVDGKNRQINEALTEYFTKKMMGSEYPANSNVAYKYNLLLIEKMESGFGEHILQEAYYQNKPQLLKSKYEAVMGEGTWDKLSLAFDESLKKYSKQEEQDIREHYLKTKTRLITQTDIIRKKAADYANENATLFAAKSTGEKNYD